jgi:hypothetical protein
MGSTAYLNASVVADLDAVPHSEPEPHPFDPRDGAIDFDVTLSPLSVAAFTFRLL